ncbi:MAG: aldehyde-activating protein [Hyphococcus sp.]|nr:MAG: aldehyde-activating protein [Marinicaulis sp.]
MENLTGQCLCGAIKFSCPKDDLKPADACHCSQCRRWSGHVWASVNAPYSAVMIADEKGALKWHRASDYARRGFCGNCGSSLFWQADGLDKHKDRIAIALGALDAPTGLALTEHIFITDKGDYYCIADGLPQKDKF